MNLYTDIINDALTLLHAHGIVPTVERGKHIKIKWNDAGRACMLVVSRTPSTVFARRRSLGVLRRMLRRAAA